LRASLILSLVLHGAVLSVALSAFGTSEQANKPPVSVDIVTPSEISAIKAGKRDAKDDAAAPSSAAEQTSEETTDTAARLKPAETPSQKQAALPPPKPRAVSPEREPEEKPEQKPAAQTPPIDTAEQPRKSVPVPIKRAERPAPPREPARTIRPRKQDRPRPRRDDRIAELIEEPLPRAEGDSDFDPDRISALLNRDPTAGGGEPDAEQPRPWRQPGSLQEQASGAEPREERRVARGRPSGRDARMTANEIDAFRAQISRCWTPPVGGLGGDTIIVKLRIALNEDGSLARPPEIRNEVNSPFFRPAADSAVRAVMQCQPYRMPREKYGQWRDMLLTFDPRNMYGG